MKKQESVRLTCAKDLCFILSIPSARSFQFSFHYSINAPFLLHRILIPYALLDSEGEARLHLKGWSFGRSGVPLLCVGMKQVLALYAGVGSVFPLAPH